MNRLWLVAAVLFTGLLGACMVGPDYKVPETKVNGAWIEGPAEGVKRDPTVDAAWWKVFNDPVIVDLVADAYRNNLELRVAGVRILQALAQRNAIAANIWPQSQTLSGSYARERVSETYSAEGFPFPPANYWNNWSTGFNVSWELDFWGKYRRSTLAADAELEATIAGYDSVMIALVAEVAATYVAIRTAEEKIGITQSNIKAQTHAVFLAQERFDAGAATLVDVTQSTSFLAQTRAELAGLIAQHRTAVFQLAALLGRPPGLVEDYLRAPGKIPVAPRNVAAGAPADLLRRRPDVRIAERTAAAQSELIGAEKANLFPSFSLVGAIGLQSNKYSQLWQTSSWIGFIAPGFSWPILNYGRIQNNVRAQDAAFQAAAISYQNTVLRAAQEVESSLATFSGSLDQVAALGDSAAQAQRSLDLVLQQYLEGLSDYTRVLQTQQTLLSVQIRLAEARSASATSLISTYKALGGGWEIRDGLRDIVPRQTMDEMRGRTNWGDYFEQLTAPPPPNPNLPGK